MRFLVRGRLYRVLVAVLIVAAAGAVAFGVSRMGYPTVASSPEESSDEAGKVEVDANNIARVTISSDAAARIGLRTAAVSANHVAGHTVLTIPAAAVFYGSEGDTWAYVASEPLVFVREHIGVAAIQGEVATLTAGPPAGTTVVTQGAAELYGTEVGVGEE